MNTEFNFEDNFLVVVQDNKKFKGYLDETLFQCKEYIEFLKLPRSIRFIAGMVLKNQDKFETTIEHKNDLACDINGASSSNPKEHLKVNFVISKNEEKIPAYFNLIHYDN